MLHLNLRIEERLNCIQSILVVLYDDSRNETQM